MSIFDDEIFMIHPLPAHLLNNNDTTRGRRPHLIVKRGTIDFGNKTIDKNEGKPTSIFMYATLRRALLLKVV